MTDEININLRAITDGDLENLLFLLNNSTFLIPDEDNQEAKDILEKFMKTKDSEEL